MKCVLVGSGTFVSTPYIKKHLKSSEMVVAVDGGLNTLLKEGIVPDVVIGDRDSVSYEATEYLVKESIKVITYPQDKDYTDSELSKKYAIEKGATEIILLGMTGTRLDHSLANIFMMEDIISKGIQTELVDEHNVVFIVVGKKVIKKADYKDFKYISFIPLTDVLEITLKGFQYELENYKITSKSEVGRGISNIILSEEATINVSYGKALFIASND